MPKQSELLTKLLEPMGTGGPKFLAYIGGIGSGKTVSGCISMLAMAIMHPGDYLICRQFMPELKTTTLKTFLDILPPDLLIEHRIADNYVKIKAVNGKHSIIFFRQLEDPDKLRSMNLSGFLIDEANQVTESAFMLLQGRLRGPGLRKGFIVSNPNGHDWVYRWFVKKDHMKSDWAKNQYYLIQAPSTENKHLSSDYLEPLMAAWSEERIKREIYGSFDAFEGMVYSEFRRDIHAVKPFRIPDDWPRYIGIDHGYRNPSAWIWVAVGPDGELYAYREFYEREWLIKEVINGSRREKKIGVIELMGHEKITRAVIDPSTKARRGATGESDYDEYAANLPQMFPLYMAQNDKTLGIDRVKSYLKVNKKTNRPLLYIFDTCTNLLEEMAQYRYQELKPGQEDKKAAKEEPYKVHDHALDALRYVTMLMPEPYKEKVEAIEDRLKYGTMEHTLYKDLQEAKNPHKRGVDPFGD